MKNLLMLMVLFTGTLTRAQTRMPGFLAGTWKMEDSEVYEHWDLLNADQMKGFSYKMSGGMMVISEYLDIVKFKKQIQYSATVKDQNGGKGVSFKLVRSDSVFVFENMKHDFPKRIAYRKLNDSLVKVQISDGQSKAYSYQLDKIMPKTTRKDSTIANPNYDEELAKKLRGDELGMKSYFLVILKTGTNTSTDPEYLNMNFRGHMDNINRLVKEGKMIVAGPLSKNPLTYRGIFIFHNVASKDELIELLKKDTAIANGIFDYEIFNWYGSAALPEYLPFSDKIWKLKP